MTLKKHHKIMIGGFSSLLIIVLITNTIFIYFLYAQLQFSNNQLKKDIIQLQADTQNKINELTLNIIETKGNLNKLDNTLSSLDESLNVQLKELKDSSGDDFSSIFKKSVKSVVTIRTDIGQGTGFIITNDGYLITNAHVLSGATKVNALTYEKGPVNANFIGYDANLDIALLKIEGDYQPLKLGNSENIRIGQDVIAIGNPLGLQFSVSQGIISGIHRIGTSGLNVYIQTDAALNPGNSGGPLINKQGEVIGINNFKVGGGENLGFALESNYIKEAVDNISQDVLNQTLI